MDNPRTFTPLKYIQEAYINQWHNKSQLLDVIEQAFLNPLETNVHGVTNKELGIIALNTLKNYYNK